MKFIIRHTCGRDGYRIFQKGGLDPRYEKRGEAYPFVLRLDAPPRHYNGAFPQHRAVEKVTVH